MINYKMTWDMARFKRKMGALGNEVVQYISTEGKRLAEMAFDIIVAATPETGEGRTDIKELYRLTMSRKAMVETYLIKNIYPDQDIIVFFEEGTRPHIIVPRNKKVLRWESAETGEEIFARRVRHPGTVAHHMFAQAEEEIQPKIDYLVMATYKMKDKIMRG